VREQSKVHPPQFYGFSERGVDKTRNLPDIGLRLVIEEVNFNFLARSLPYFVQLKLSDHSVLTKIKNSSICNYSQNFLTL